MASTCIKCSKKAVFIKKFPDNLSDRKIELKIYQTVKCRAKFVSFISFVVPITKKCCSYYQDLYLCLSLMTVIQSSGLSYFTKSSSYCRYCEHLQHFAKEICSSCFMPVKSLDTYTVKNNSSFTVFINLNNTVF